ncbi:MAG: cobalamin-dependent protein [Planctomycetota bacterium]|nr:cobalamin-dependent protein [Planctomycetota bacterium]
MDRDLILERYFEALINGNRPSARQIVREFAAAHPDPEKVIVELHWPVYELIERLWRADQLSILSYNFATRLLRQLVDQTGERLPQAPRRGRRVFACCGTSQAEELAAQMAMDVLESGGFDVAFAGGGIPGDEIIARVHETKPDVLLLFASAASDLPEVRRVIDTLHSIGACPNVQIVVGGGVFNRADGLAEEIGADLYASDPLDLVDVMINQPARRVGTASRTVGKPKKLKKAA